MARDTPVRDTSGNIIESGSVVHDITDLKQAEDALRESENRYRTLFECMQEGFYLSRIILDDDGRPCDYIYLDANQAFERIMGLPRDQIIGRSAKELVPNLKSDWLEVFGKVTLTGEPARYSSYSEVFNKHFEVIVFRPAQGQFAVLVTDITERKRAEEALHKSEERYATTLASIGDAVIATDAAGKITFMNAVAEELTGWTFEEASMIPAKEVFNIINEYTRQKVEDPVAKVLDKGMIVGLANHTILIRRDGTEVAIDDSGAPIKDSNGNISGVVLVFRDITGRKRMEDELALLASFPKFNPNPIVEVDLAGKVHFLNPAAQELFPDLQERVCSHPWLADWEAVVQSLCENETRTHVREIPIGERWYQQAMYPVPGTQRVRIYGLDITERRQADERLRTTLESIGDGFFACDSDWRFVYVNAQAERILGIRREDVLGKSHWDVFPLTLGTSLEREYRRAAAGETIDFENFYEPWGRWFHNRCYPREGGGMSVYFEDITERKRAEDVLQTNLQRFYAVLSSMYAGILLVADNGRIEFANQAFCDLFDLKDSPADLTGLTSPEMIEKIKNAYLHPDEEVTRIREIVGRGQPVKGEEIAMRGGRTCLRDFIPLYIDGKSYGRLWHHLEITERKRHEEKIAKLTRLYAVLSQVNETIVRAHDAESLYSEICRIVSEVGGFPLVWIGQVKEQQVVPVAWSGPAADYLKEIKVEVQGELGNGPTGTCIQKNRAIINDDFATNPATSPWREPALHYGFRASAAFPLHRQGKAIGAFTLYASEPNVFDAEQVGLLESLSSDISYAIDALDQEQLRLRAEEDLRETRDYLESLIDYANAPIIVWDPSFRITRFNHAFERLTGLRAAEALGEPLSILFPESSRDKSLDHIRRALAGEHWETVEIPILKSDGSIRTVLWNSANIYVRNETTIIATIAQGQDITDRKLAEELLQEAKEELEVSAEELRQQNDVLLRTQSALQMSEEHARARSDELEIVLDSVPAGIWIAHDPQALHITGNKLSYEWLHIPPGANASKSAPEGERPETFRMFKDGKELQPGDMPVQLSAMGKEIHDYEFTFVYPDGTERYVLGNAMPLLSDNGNSRGSVSSFIDITKRKQMEAELRNSEQLYRAIGESIDYGVWVCAPDGRNIYASESFLKLVGITQEQCSNFGWGDTLHPDDIERTIAAWKEFVLYRRNMGHRAPLPRRRWKMARHSCARCAREKRARRSYLLGGNQSGHKPHKACRRGATQGTGRA